jgi:hypothetical protein
LSCVGKFESKSSAEVRAYEACVKGLREKRREFSSYLLYRGVRGARTKYRRAWESETAAVQQEREETEQI